MVKRLKLNEKTVREAANLGRDYQIFDTDVRGFSVTIYPSGNRAFTLDYRVAGRQRRMTIGRWPEWTATAAQERAKQLRREIDEGGDPSASARRHGRRPDQRSDRTVSGGAYAQPRAPQRSRPPYHHAQAGRSGLEQETGDGDHQVRCREAPQQDRRGSGPAVEGQAQQPGAQAAGAEAHAGARQPGG